MSRVPKAQASGDQVPAVAEARSLSAKPLRWTGRLMQQSCNSRSKDDGEGENVTIPKVGRKRSLDEGIENCKQQKQDNLSGEGSGEGSSRSKPVACVDCYKRFFAGQHHFNLIGRDITEGPVLLSIAPQDKQYQVMLWLSSGNFHKVVPVESLGLNPSPIKLAQQLNGKLEIYHFKSVTCLDASNLIANYENCTQATKHKFAVLTSTDWMSGELDKFLSVLGQRVRKRNRIDVYTVFKGRDIKFRVMRADSPKRPEVAILFQKGSASTSEMVKNGEMHTIIVVQPLVDCQYNVSVVTRDDPAEREPTVFKKGSELKEFLVAELISAENARTAREIRTPLLEKLIEELEQKTQDFIGEDSNWRSDFFHVLNCYNDLQRKCYNIKIDEDEVVAAWEQLEKLMNKKRRAFTKILDGLSPVAMLELIS